MKTKIFITLSIATLLASCVPPRVLTAEDNAYAAKMMGHPTEFTVPKDQSDEAWGRANHFLSLYSSMRMQMATELLLTTYNPLEIGQYGYEITRMPTKDIVTISVRCFSFTGNIFSDQRKEADQNAHAAAYYIATGAVIPYFVYH